MCVLGGALHGGCHLMRSYSWLTVKQNLEEAGNYVTVSLPISNFVHFPNCFTVPLKYISILI